MELQELDVYRIARELSRYAWQIYSGLKNEYRFSIGRQFLESIDSVGANIAEGYGRYHYMDSVKFYYNARGSLWEFKHWNDILNERGLISEEDYEAATDKIGKLGLKLNNFISSTKSKVNK